jgi:hypothetical protein
VLEAEEGWEAWGREAGDTRETVEGVGYILWFDEHEIMSLVFNLRRDAKQCGSDVLRWLNVMREHI